MRGIEENSIMDLTQPNAGRVYDYFIGGHHNFEVDRQAAEQLLKTLPSMPKFLQLGRWFLQEATIRLLDVGYDKFLDFASGLPTVKYIHELAPQARVIYSDIDPVVVTYGREIIGDNPNVRYELCDAGRPEDLLELPVVSELFGEDRRVAIILNGILMFLSEDEIAHAARVLYDWAAEGSCLATSTETIPTEKVPKFQKILDMYEQMGEDLYARSVEVYQELLQPWQPDEHGFQTAEYWLGIEKAMSEEEAMGASRHGAFLFK
jgi:O-methyltransferase involved in polyketide biosynthesis